MPAFPPSPRDEDAVPLSSDNDAGTIIVTASDKSKGDPVEALNHATFAVASAADKAVVGPIAEAYRHIAPKPFRDGVHNFFRNLHEPVVVINFLFQLKVASAAKQMVRFGVNSTVGVAGLVDVAKRKPLKIPYRHNGFADTLCYYGVGNGPFFFLPLIGPTTLRDFAGTLADNAIVPVVTRPVRIGLFRSSIYTSSHYVLHTLDKRLEKDDEIKTIRSSKHPYDTMRDGYLCNRKAEIEALHNRKPEDCAWTGIDMPD